MIVVLVLLAWESSAGLGPGPGGLPPAGGFAGGQIPGCNAPSASPSAVHVSVATPGKDIASGGSLTVQLEVAALNASNGALPTQVYLPSLTAIFPRSPSGTWTLYIAPKVLTLNGTGWSSAATLSQSKAVGTKLAFAPGTASYVTSQKLALMVVDPYGSLTLGFRWQWSEVVRNGQSPVTGGWSTVSPTAVSPDLPSQFLPAPYVALSLGGSITAAPGANVTLPLSGAVANTTFRIVVEYPTNGTEITSRWLTSPAQATVYNATAPMTYAHGAPLAAGKYLIHVHDRCQAILHSLSVTVT